MRASADLILANRAYLDHQVPPGAKEPTPAGNGGLLAAVRPVIEPWADGRGTTWIGAGRGKFDRDWVDDDGCELLQTPRGLLRHRRLFFDDVTWRAHYGAVANSFLWPLLHLVREPLPERVDYYPAPKLPSSADWQAYRDVNESFAEAAIRERPGGTAWVHDYQLALVPATLRTKGYRGRIGFFLHTPFPAFSLASRYLSEESLPLFREFVVGILGAGLIGLQSEGDVSRFAETAEKLLGARPTPGGLEYDGRHVALGSYPVGIDSEELLLVGRRAEPPAQLSGLLASGLPVVVGLERADFTKGIPERLAAVAEAYRRGARFAYAGIAAPTRHGVKAYDHLAEAIERAAAEAAGAAAKSGNSFRHAQEVITWPEVVALQARADVMFTSSLADGMNLVPMQTAVVQSLRDESRRSVILAGRDAGVSAALSGFESEGLVPVDPLDPSQLTHALLEALAGRPGRVSDRLIATIRRNDALSWATKFLADLETTC